MKLCGHQDLRLENVQKIKNFILRNGERKSYCNKYSHNPHLAFLEFGVYLNPGPVSRGPHFISISHTCT